MKINDNLINLDCVELRYDESVEITGGTWKEFWTGFAAGVTAAIAAFTVAIGLAKLENEQ